MDDDQLNGLREQLDAHHDWPSEYMFKFIAPNQIEKIEAILAVFPDGLTAQRRVSGGGRYVSLTICELMPNADGVFDRYRDVHAIGGIFAL